MKMICEHYLKCKDTTCPHIKVHEFDKSNCEYPTCNRRNRLFIKNSENIPSCCIKVTYTISDAGEMTIDQLTNGIDIIASDQKL